jgi:hypothetical protein
VTLGLSFAVMLTAYLIDLITIFWYVMSYNVVEVYMVFRRNVLPLYFPETLVIPDYVASHSVI